MGMPGCVSHLLLDAVEQSDLFQIISFVVKALKYCGCFVPCRSECGPLCCISTFA